MDDLAKLDLGFGLSFGDLYERAGLQKLDAAFAANLAGADADLAARLAAARKAPDALERSDESDLISDLAPHLESFIATLFGIEKEVAALVGAHDELAPIYRVKREFVRRQALKGAKAEELDALDIAPIAAKIEAVIGGAITDLSFARAVEKLQAAQEAGDESAGELLTEAKTYAAWATLSNAGKEKHAGAILFTAAGKIDRNRMIGHLHTAERDGQVVHSLPEGHLRQRNGFELTDCGGDLNFALDQANYCIWCHKQGKDSCSKGLRERKPAEGKDKPDFQVSEQGVRLAGCPLEEKISEFQLAKSEGHPLGAFAIITIDNPMVAGTGHRICNDCVKSCIYQKQDPVNIPQVETRTMKDVLSLPWGFEIYSLLTRWNPLNIARPLPLADSGKKVLVVGMGPAGYTLAHYLINSGHTVVGIDGLKIEPLPEDLTGVTREGKRVAFRPVHDIESELFENLDERVLAGFGGVAEYGITVRWDKNFLKVIRLLLERRAQFALFDGIRFGGTISVEDAWKYGFDHVAMATGAGRPTLLNIPNGMARGVRTASDFLMGLQLTGAAKKDSIANLQLRLPIVVIGGGLTAVDTATESLAYYVRHVEKFLGRYERLSAAGSEIELRANWSDEEVETADEWLLHARAIRTERERAEAAGQTADIGRLLRGWGGATVAYRKRLIDAPAYRLNHEEVEKALEEGIFISECVDPKAIEIDRFGHVSGLRLARQVENEDGKWTEGEIITAPARAVFVAAGTQPNTVLAREEKGLFRLDGKYFQPCDTDGNPVEAEWSHSKPADPAVLLARNPQGRFMSFFGDLHPSFFGNVVKAMASAKQGYPTVNKVLENTKASASEDGPAFFARLYGELRPAVVRVERLTPNIVEVVMRAPASARNFKPGQFFRVQNYEKNAIDVGHTKLAMEGLALTGAWVDREKGLIAVIVLEMGGSSNLCTQLKPGEPVVLMGPTGGPTEIPQGETVLLVGGGLGNAVLFSIGQAMRQAGCKVLYFAGYKKRHDLYKVDDIENASDLIVWCCDEADVPQPRRPQDRAFHGNIVQAIRAYGEGEFGEQPIPLGDVDRIIAIGSDKMMAAVAAARKAELSHLLKADHFAIGSINSPMQCMMKEICAQCVQPHTDPVTGKKSFVFTCFEQDQPLDRVDWGGLAERLKQNSVSEKVTANWIRYCLQNQPAQAAE